VGAQPRPEWRFLKTGACQIGKLALCIYVVKAKQKRVARVSVMRFAFKIPTTTTMKKHQMSRRAKGFTLIELLVVITIIAVLAGLSFAGVNLAIKKAKKTEGLVMATSLATAVENFYGEYNRLPDVQGEVKTGSGQGVKLLEVLLALEGNGSDVDNTRSIIFLQGKEAKGKKGGIDYGSGDSVEGLYDPFGNEYTVILNDDYADSLNFQFGNKRVQLRGKQVAVYSLGGDKKAGTPDDIKSWN
jgi:prepilin-type N-terminal cleavage/methylation domain-containing protein